jgi:hyperosmotically inducible protein
MMIRTVLISAALALVLSACSVIRGQETMKEYSSDTAVTAAVKSKFATDPAVDATAIGVETLNGVVQLSGFAKSTEEKRRAEALAREEKSVKSVRNDIIVRP